MPDPTPPSPSVPAGDSPLAAPAAAATPPAAAAPGNSLYPAAAPAVNPAAAASDTAPAEPALDPMKVESPLTAEKASPLEPDGKEPEKVEAKPAEPIDPASYEITPPEGVEVNPEALTAFRAQAAQAGLTQEQVKAFTDLHFGQVKLMAEAQAKAWSETMTAWKNETLSDPTVGGAKFDEASKTIGRALDQYGTPQAREAFALTGAGWNPHIIRFIHSMAEQLTEGSVVGAKGPVGPRNRQPQNVLYPESNS